MEFLVTLTTFDTQGTAVEVDREGTRGYLQRLWHTPVGRAEERVIGLFTAEDRRRLDKVLACLPRRTRVAEVAELDPHPDDPARTGLTGRPGVGPEYLIATTVTVPDDTPADVIAGTVERESERARAFAGRGNLVRLWSLTAGPDGPRAVGLWRARDPGELMAILESLPLSGWMTIDTTPLSPHPDDPVRGL
ncbi:MAG: muconolactone Delta-isomerase family protein [Mycobacterium sp.]